MEIKESFQYFYAKFGIEVPIEIQSHCLDVGNGESEFMLLFKSLIRDIQIGYQPHFVVQISEAFANEILKLVFEVPDKERVDFLFKQISNHSFNGIKNLIIKDNQLFNTFTKENIKDNVEEFIISEIFYAVNDYDTLNDRFNFGLVQNAYERLGSNQLDFKLVLILWMLNGGEGGVILRGKHAGYSCSYAHHEFKEIEVSGRKFVYPGFLSSEYEKPYY